MNTDNINGFVLRNCDESIADLALTPEDETKLRERLAAFDPEEFNVVVLWLEGKRIVGSSSAKFDGCRDCLDAAIAGSAVHHFGEVGAPDVVESLLLDPRLHLGETPQ